MIVAQQSAEDFGGVSTAPVVYFANHIGVSFSDTDPIAQNKALQEVLKTVDPTDLVKEDGKTCFSINHRELGHFVHLLYVNAAEDNKIVVDFDGTFPFQAVDEQGERQLYNAQLITITEQPQD